MEADENMIPTRTHELFKKLVPAVREIYGDNLLKIILYGSVARNTATEDSDIDIAFLVKKTITICMKNG